ncbi:dicarboxylate transporter/tellurite-resistance protein TehA [Cupriavidus sp. 2TAF22]|uniref:SLAC1 family transporter n=1 Tax=unclassified Cupriavidus TaxID=2640874 RepID=UPI003F90E85B
MSHEPLHPPAAGIAPACAANEPAVPHAAAMAPPLPAAAFSIVLGLAVIGRAWRHASTLWQMPHAISETILACAALLWAGLLVTYAAQLLHRRGALEAEFAHPVRGSTPALLAIATLQLVPALLPYSPAGAWLLAVAGIGWHLAFALWHTGRLWQGGRDPRDTTPALYLPTVAANLASGATLGVLGHADWGWLFVGAGTLSWLALESQVVGRLLQHEGMPASQRALLGIQFAPPMVCAAACLAVAPQSAHSQWILMLLGYGLFQMLLGLRLFRWLGEQPFHHFGSWSYTFGLASAAVGVLQLALAGVPAARALAGPFFLACNLVIGYLALRTAGRFAGSLAPRAAAPAGAGSAG